MATKVTYSWIIYSCLVSGSGILCDRKLERRQAVSSCSVNTDDKFYCSNGLCIESSWVCDGRKDCSDGSDETTELCALYEYGTTGCGRVEFFDFSGKAVFGKAHWNVGIYRFENLNYQYLCHGSIIAPNVVISRAECFFYPNMLNTKISVPYGKLKVAVGKYNLNFSKIDNEYTQILNVETIYIKESYNGKEGSYAEDIAVIVLENKGLITSDVSPICIDWNGKYMVHNGDIGRIFVFEEVVNGIENSVLLERFVQFIDTSNCQKNFSTKYKHLLTFDKFCTTFYSRKEAGFLDSGAGIGFVHSNSYFLTGMMIMRHARLNGTIAGFVDIRFYVQWIRGILNKHFTDNSCVLPTVVGVIYSYEGSNEILSHGKLINLHRTVIEKCEQGYYKAHPIGFRFCQGKGKWLSNTEKLCFKMCPPLISDSLDIKCSHNSKYANCSNLSIPDTIATASCKPFYTALISQEDTQLELNCQANGLWNKQLNRCNPICGRVYIINQVLINNGKKALVGTAPWNVGIYQLNKKKTNYNLICGGSIIAPNLVISAAHCFWKKAMLSKKISITDGLYKIAVGKYDRNFTIIDNEFTQIINVETIHLKEGYYGPTGFHAEDIAIIVLENLVSFSNGVSPVCIDWNGEYNVANGDQGKIVGWGKTEKGISSPILLEASLPYIDHSTCRDMYTNGFELFMTVDKFCAGSTLGNGADFADSGAGISFLHSNSYFLTGMLNMRIADSNSAIAGFLDIRFYIQWIRGILNKHFTENSCVLPTVEGVIYSYEGSNEILSHGTLIKRHRTVIEKCEHGYHKAYPIGFRFCRGKGKWLSNTEKLCFKMCPSLISDSLDIKCSHNGKYTNCSNLSIPDTIAKTSCKPFYTAPISQEDTPLELNCQANGTWNKQLYRCNPNCGRVYIISQVLINNGKKALVGTASWNVGIYQLNKKKTNYDLICGGSIIAPNLVISAAHCFWKKALLSKKISVTDGLYKIAVGKYDRNFTIIDNEFTQIINVETIHLKEGYYGANGFYAEDISIIVLQDRVSFSNGVSPVCVDWNGKYNVVNGDKGKIVGWGKTEKGISSPILLEASLPYIDHSTCRNMYTNGFELFMTVDKFCAGSTLDCGRVYIINQVLINNGKKALVGTAPWNVGIYQLNKKKTNYDLICGGSIIAPNLVISAAHCFWKKAMLSKKISITDGLYKIAVGKYDRNFTIIDNEFTQIINVETIHLKEGYYGADGFHAEDISIIVLQERVSFSNGVSPVCIDWNGKYNVVNGDQGKIVGWGITEKGISSPILLEASLPYIDHSTCRNMYTNGFELFMTVDKFCAGSTLVSEQGVSKGDSGAGLCFFHSDSYYLTGVVSIKDPNTTNSIAVFTEVKYHIQWIRGLFNKYN
ncbi:uncharacterized protein LOC100574854 isoform X3 [Acyrthosiphon pisum]|uniref:Peptidase S1 domain-containing protein n=1 Tax=Acyrthosiphon pisum TaxID=7029 RepID=A0A8R2JS54_ACYPI|nr:uncharacterized protein LOC100574854 isoform X3 [Acyrthosiphon pisum]